MKASFFALAAFALPLLTAVNAQAPFVCFQDCANTSVEAFNCPGLDFNCYCGIENGEFIKKLSECVRNTCSADVIRALEPLLDPSKCPARPTSVPIVNPSATVTVPVTTTTVTTGDVTQTVTTNTAIVPTTAITTTIVNGTSTITTTILPPGNGNVTTVPTSTSLTTFTDATTTLTTGVTTFFGTSTVTDAPEETETDRPDSGATQIGGQYFAIVAAGIAALVAAF